MAAVAEARPETLGWKTFNEILNTSVVSLDGEGKDFDSVVYVEADQLQSKAKALQGRVTAKILEYYRPDADLSKVSDEHAAFEKQYNRIVKTRS